MLRDEFIELGKLGRVHGLRGGIKFHPYNLKSTSVTKFCTIYLGDLKKELIVSLIKGSGKNQIVYFKGIDCSEEASNLVNKVFYLKRSELKKLSDCEYYINDLIGHDVIDCNGKSLGVIDKYYDNGAQMVACLSSGFEFPLVSDLVEIINLNDSSSFLTQNTNY